MEDWLINYYEQTDPLKRQQMLLENKNETMSEEDKLRMKLWETRYGKGKPRKDMFVGYLMNLKYIDNEKIYSKLSKVALLLLFLEWDSCQMKALQERSLNK